MEKPAAILLDINGVTTDQDLVSRKLDAFLGQQSNVQNYLRETCERPETKELVKRLCETRASAPEEAQLPPIVSPSSSQDKIFIKSLADFSVELMSNISGNGSGSNSQQTSKNSVNNSVALQRFIAVHAELTALLWCWALEEGKLAGHLFDEVSFSMHQWKEVGRLRMYIFSPHQNVHQRLLLAATNHGNLEPLISGYFDQELGPATEAASYRRILREIAQENSAPLGRKLLYITAVPKQASAALEAGLKVALIQRTPPDLSLEGLNEVKEAGVLLINSLEELKFK